MPARTLIVGLDSAEPDLVRAWAAEGRLPNLERLLATGDGRDILNLPGFGNGVFWPCIHTGTDPSFHGGYYLRQAEPPSYAIKPFTKHDYRLLPFWRSLEDDGLDVAVIDPVEAPIGKLTRGIEILDWNVHRREEPPQSSPPELIARIIERYGDNPFHGNIDRMVIDGLSPESRGRANL
jgi:predicted AlkP superfamily phosphohydrolase/phosphomutase